MRERERSNRERSSVCWSARATLRWRALFTIDPDDHARTYTLLRRNMRIFFTSFNRWRRIHRTETEQKEKKDISWLCTNDCHPDGGHRFDIKDLDSKMFLMPTLRRRWTGELIFGRAGSLHQHQVSFQQLGISMGKMDEAETGNDLGPKNLHLVSPVNQIKRKEKCLMKTKKKWGKHIEADPSQSMPVVVKNLPIRSALEDHVLPLHLSCK